MKTLTYISLGSLLFFLTHALNAQVSDAERIRPVVYDHTSADSIIAEWPERPRLAATEMINKYGAPQEVTAERIVWWKAGPFKQITVTRIETPHDFPKPHMDFIEHTVAYRVPIEKSNELTAFDGSVTFERTRGELSARCDLEEHNLLSLNLANDVASGKKSAVEARRAFGETLLEQIKGQRPAYMSSLQFRPLAEPALNLDQPTIPGVAVRAPKDNSEVRAMLRDWTIRESVNEAELLGLIAAINENEILAASRAQLKNLAAPIMSYARMLESEHSKNLDELLQLTKLSDLKAEETEAVDQMRVKAAGELATLIPLNGTEFANAYLDAMIKGHTEVLAIIDKQLPAVKTESLRQHLVKTRESVSSHLEEAKRLRT